MHDLESIRRDPEGFDRDLARRGLPAAAGELLELDARRRRAVAKLQEMQTQRNALAKEIGARKAKGQDAAGLLAEASDLKEGTSDFESLRLQGEIQDEIARLPNRLAADVPDGQDEAANKEIRRWGEKPSFPFVPQDHAALGEGLSMMDFKVAARMSGSRFVVLKGPLARLERALGNFMLDLQVREHGYLEVSPPSLIKGEALFGTGQLPKFVDDLFRTTDGRWLVPTAEVTLANLVRERILDAGELPLRFAAWTPCFRSEAGAAGKDTRGMIRLHEFRKVELVSIVRPQDSAQELERMTQCAEEVLKRLEIPHRTVALAAGDTAFSARKSYDIEAWLPGQSTYREISSCSDCGDFQARRMDARFQEKGKKPRHVHTLNGSGVAVGRLFVALLENHQEQDGSIRIPEALRPYMDGAKRIQNPNQPQPQDAEGPSDAEKLIDDIEAQMDAYRADLEVILRDKARTERRLRELATARVAGLEAFQKKTAP